MAEIWGGVNVVKGGVNVVKRGVNLSLAKKYIMILIYVITMLSAIVILLMRCVTG